MKLGNLILGALIGAAAALFLSPERAQQWRDKLKGQGDKLRDGARDIGAKVPTAGNAATADVFNSVKEKSAEFIGEAGEHLRDMKQSAAQKIGEVKQEASGQARVVRAEVSDATDEKTAKPD